MTALEAFKRSRLEAIVERVLMPGAVLLMLLIPLPFIAGVTDASSAILGTTLALVGAGIALAQPPAVRRFALSLFIWSLVLRLAVLVALSAVLGYDRGAQLGPDSVSYYLGSQMIAARGLPANPTAYDVFGSTDIAHYYLFAAALSAFHVDLFGLQLLNGALSALTALVTYLWCKTVLPSHAALTGVLVAAAPTLIALSVTGLLKDPSIVLATVLTLWAIARLIGASRGLSAGAWGLLAVAALAYLRMDRFYVAAYLEAAFILVVVVLLARRAKLSPVPIVVLALVVVVAEAAPVALGWPTSPAAVINNVLHVGQSPGLRESTPGIIDSVGHVDASPPPPGSTPGGVVPRATDAPSVPMWIRDITRILSPIADALRRLYGPFIWIPPPDLRAETIFGGDYVLYPGMLIWYALLPLMLVGVVVVPWRLFAMRTTDIVLPAVAIFLIVYLAQYVVINLSYRQREDVLPLLLVFLPFGTALWSRLGHSRILYGAYWVVLALGAVVHVAIRTLV